jgi:hypothetical protein
MTTYKEFAAEFGDLENLPEGYEIYQEHYFCELLEAFGLGDYSITSSRDALRFKRVPVGVGVNTHYRYKLIAYYMDAKLFGVRRVAHDPEQTTKKYFCFTSKEDYVRVKQVVMSFTIDRSVECIGTFDTHISLPKCLLKGD